MKNSMLILLGLGLLCACGDRPPTLDEINAQMTNVQASMDEVNNVMAAREAAENERSAAIFEAELPDRVQAVRDRTRRQARIERACLNSPQMPGWDCGFGDLADALRWEWEHQRRFGGGVLDRP